MADSGVLININFTAVITTSTQQSSRYRLKGQNELIASMQINESQFVVIGRIKFVIIFDRLIKFDWN